MTVFPYENPSLSPDERAADLLRQLSLTEKAGLMFHTLVEVKAPDIPNSLVPSLGSLKDLVARGINHFNLLSGGDDAADMAAIVNSWQEVALAQRSKIPITVSTDPRHAFSTNVLASMSSGCFSKWPEQLGMIALHSAERMREYCDIVRQEYLAVGIRAALHPQVDLATSYQWSRICGGFGEDADIASELTTAYIKGLQGESIGPQSVAACVKHFPGGGPQRGGDDCHMQWGAEADYPGDNWEYHLKPFRAAVNAGVSSVMPSYGKPMGTKYPEVAMAYNKPIITGLLRDDLKFQGICLSDWCIIDGFPESGDDAFAAKCWGVEHLSRDERLIMALDAGVDQFGGDTCVEALVALVQAGKIPESRIDKSALLLLREKFALGLFDKPMVDVSAANSIAGSEKFIQAGLHAQRDSLTLLKNKSVNGKPALPLTRGTKVYAEGFDEFGSLCAHAVSDPAQADVILVRLDTPWTAKGKGELARSFHHGSLEFKPETLSHVAELARHAPVVLDLYLDRPAIIGSLNQDATAILCNYGVCAEALVDVLFGDDSPKGRLPFDLPRSMQAVLEKKVDTAFDSKDPVYRCGDGLSY